MANENHPLVEKILSRLMDVVPGARSHIASLIPELRTELKKLMPEGVAQVSGSLQAALATAEAKIEELTQTNGTLAEANLKYANDAEAKETELADYAKQIDQLKKQLSDKDLALTAALVKVGQLQGGQEASTDSPQPEPAANPAPSEPAAPGAPPAA